MILADEALDHASVRLIEQFRREQPPWSDVPIIVLTRRPTRDSWESAQGLLGQVSIIERPTGRRPLLSLVQAALAARRRQYQAREQLLELRRISDELRIANSSKDQLLGLVSHELRTPLTGILGCASILERRFDVLREEDRLGLVHDIGDHATRLQRIIENMLILSRAENAAEGVVLEPVLLQRTLPPVIRAMNPLRGGRRLEVRADEHLPPANANEVFVEQVVSNLVRNSEKYASPGTLVSVAIHSPAPDTVAVTVADQGQWLDQEQVDRMFDAFYRAPENELLVPGLGLGLAVCQRLTEVQGGSICARPRAEGGLEVTVSFPVAAE